MQSVLNNDLLTSVNAGKLSCNWASCVHLDTQIMNSNHREVSLPCDFPLPYGFPLHTVRFLFGGGFSTLPYGF